MRADSASSAPNIQLLLEVLLEEERKILRRELRERVGGAPHSALKHKELLLLKAAEDRYSMNATE
jgi:hypothetical protein